MLGGPLSSLYYMGFFPCCQNEEDKSARDALKQLNSVGTRMIWHREQNRLVENVKATFSFFGGGGKKRAADGKDDENSPIVKAYFKISDNSEGIPEIEVGKRSLLLETSSSGGGGFEDEDESDFSLGMEDPEAPSKKSAAKKKKAGKEPKIITSLKRIHTVVPFEQDMIILNILEADGQKTQPWAKITMDAQDQSVRNLFIINLQILMEWDKNRRNNCGELEYDETSAASTIKARAQKVKHRMERELEMKQTRRNREERKAKYVQESGGLKYTALAMARNAGAS